MHQRASPLHLEGHPSYLCVLGLRPLFCCFMKKTYLAASLAAATLFLTACGDDAAKSAETAAPSSTASATTSAPVNAQSKDINAQSSFEDKVSYAIGASVGTYVGAMEKEQGEFIGTLDHDLVVKGFIEALGGKTALSEEDITNTLMALDQQVRTAVEAKQQQLNQANLEAGQKFLNENAKKPGVKTTDSGLQYEIIQEGTGKSPTASDVVRVKYKGTTIDGQVFDEQSSEPISFPLANIIPGWTEGLQLMKEGGKARLYIPSDLAYGELGAGDIIKPNSVLVFDIELVEVLPNEEQNQAPAGAEAAGSAQ